MHHEGMTMIHTRLFKVKNAAFIAALIAGMIGSLFAQAAPFAVSDTLIPRVQLTSEQDHARLMSLLHITSLRPGPSGNPSAPNAANSDESKANPYPELPDPLVLNNGENVTTAGMWWEVRRPEIKETFDKEIYGRVPKDVPKVTWEITSTSEDTNAGIGTETKKLLGHVDNSAYPSIKVDIDLSLTLPANAHGPVPVIMEFGFTFPPGFKMTDQLKKLLDSMSSWKQLVLSKGWGYAILIPTSLQEDNGKGLTGGIIGLANKGQPRKLDDWVRCAHGRGVPAEHWTIWKRTNLSIAGR